MNSSCKVRESEESKEGAKMNRRRFGWSFSGLIALVYLMSYLIFRSVNAEIWERDGHTYVIFGSTLGYYLYRPLSYIDGALTGMRFHIGPHPR